MKKNKAAIAVFILVTSFLVILCIWSSTIPEEAKPTDCMISRQELEPEPIYYTALSVKEQEIYDQLWENAENYTAGFVRFSEAITLDSFQRIQTSFFTECPYSGYAVALFPMTENYEFSAGQDDQAGNANVQQCMLWIYGSALTIDDMQVDNNQLQNVEQCEKLLGEIDLRVKEDILRKYDEVTKQLDQVVSKLPNTFQQMDAVEMFVTWAIEHLHAIPLAGDLYEDLNDTTEKYHIPSSLLCVSEGDSLCLGYSKVFQYLCAKAGIRCDIALGTRSINQQGHAINKVYFGDDAFYIDVGETRDANDINYMTEKTAKAYMAPIYKDVF